MSPGYHGGKFVTLQGLLRKKGFGTPANGIALPGYVKSCPVGKRRSCTVSFATCSHLRAFGICSVIFTRCRGRCLHERDRITARLLGLHTTR